MGGSAMAGLLFFAASGAYAQDVEAVVVTGTSIRGVAPVGANVISLGRDEIDASGAQSVQQLIQSVPQVSGFGNGGAEFTQGAHSTSGESTPTIHNLGASSSNSTLILIDGHNFTPSGNDGYTDPSIIPAIALQRVDILADGDSAVYGSNAVAGVLNFITRKDYEGFLTDMSFSSASPRQTFTFSQLAGHRWETGSAMIAYEYSSTGQLRYGDRDRTRNADLRYLGGSNFKNFNCSPATIAASISGTAQVYAYPYSNAPVAQANNSLAGTCSSSPVSTLLPSANTNTVFATVTQDITDKLRTRLDLNYASRVNMNQQAQSAIVGYAYGPNGSSPALGTGSINPFYEGNAAIGNSREYIRYDPTSLIGPSYNKTGIHSVSANLNLTYQFGADWEAEVNAFSGYTQSFIHNTNSVCGACALLALNGTTNSDALASNSLADTYGLGTLTSVTRVLNATNALDVWNPAAANRTPQQVINELRSDYRGSDINSDLNNVRLKLDGPLFELPAGPIRVAFGGEYWEYHNYIRNISSNGAGPGNSSSRVVYAPLARTNWSGFAEFFVPVISPEMGIPLVQSFELNVAARYDQYSDVGATRNPRIGFTWKVSDGLKWRANYGTSFTAPNLAYLNPIITGSVGSSTATFTVPAGHPALQGSTVCSATPANCVFDSTRPGLSLGIGNPELKPMTGLTYSTGFDLDAGSLWEPLQGLTMDVTYWQVKFQGGLTAVTLDNDLNLAGLQNLFKLAPPGGWSLSDPYIQSAIAGNALTTNLPTTIYYIAQTGRRNAFNIQANGIDFGVHYSFLTDNYGDFTVGLNGAEKLRFDLQGGPKGSTAPYQNMLNGRLDTSTIKATQFEGRLSTRWHMDPFGVSLMTNFTNPYWFHTTVPPFNGVTDAPAGLAPTGFQKVRANITVDLFVDYDLPEDWLYGASEGVKVTVGGHNILNSAPPFFNIGPGNFNAAGQTGYDQFNASPLGRTLQISLEKKW
jgi:iron complex outermembrane receptor protein